MPVREPLSRCGALVIDSMPPATTTPADPALMMSWASMMAFMPEPHTLLMVVAPASSWMPAAREAWRAGAWPRPAGSTQPMITSSTWPPSTPAWASAPWIAAAPRVGVGTPVNWPSMEPMAVRLAPTMTTSVMGVTPRGRGPAIIAPQQGAATGLWSGGRVRPRSRHGRAPLGLAGVFAYTDPLSEFDRGNGNATGAA